jgi:hypothetical protein
VDDVAAMVLQPNVAAGRPGRCRRGRSLSPGVAVEGGHRGSVQSRGRQGGLRGTRR